MLQRVKAFHTTNRVDNDIKLKRLHRNDGVFLFTSVQLQFNFNKILRWLNLKDENHIYLAVLKFAIFYKTNV